jgi:hypothetical protein
MEGTLVPASEEIPATVRALLNRRYAAFQKLEGFDAECKSGQPYSLLLILLKRY